MQPNLYQSSQGSFIVVLLVFGTNTSLWRTEISFNDLLTFSHMPSGLLHFCKKIKCLKVSTSLLLDTIAVCSLTCIHC